MKFFKNVLGDLFNKKKTNSYQLKADVSKCGAAPSFKRKVGDEATQHVSREKSLGLFRER